MVWRGGRVAEGNGLLNRRVGISSHRGFESRPLRWVPPLGVLWTAKRGHSSLRYCRKGRLTAERQAVF
jgi:hypothetical protein